MLRFRSVDPFLLGGGGVSSVEHESGVREKMKPLLVFSRHCGCVNPVIF